MSRKRKEKLQHLAEIEGFTDATELAKEYISDSVCPAICMNEDCDYTEEMEPDQNRGHCPECNTNTMKAAFILMGVI